MKKLFLSIIIISLFVLPALAQQADSVLASKYRLDFIIPDIPAFKALDVDPSKVMRPSDVRELAVAFNPFFNNGKPGIPKNFAVEFSPGKMRAHKWKLQSYYRSGFKRFWYNSGFSLGAVSDSAQYASKVSVGYRFSLLSKNADPIRADYINLLLDSLNNTGTLMIDVHLRNFWLARIAQITPAVYNADKERYDLEFDAFLQRAPKVVSDSNLQNDPMWTSVLNEISQVFGSKFKIRNLSLKYLLRYQNAAISDVMNSYKNRYWNASRFDMAVAWVGESKDSLFSKSRFSSFNVWITQALRIKRYGQLLMGGNLQLPNKAVDKAVRKTPLGYTANLRLLLGNRNFRFFAEGQYRHSNFGYFDNSILANGGAELKISNAFWIVASTGVDNLQEKTGGKWYSRFAGNVNLRYGINF